MKTTELVAWIGATTGLASLIWNIYTKVTANRPKLVVKAYANMVQMPSPPRNPRFLRVTVQNVGTASTTLTNLEFFKLVPRWKRLLYKLHLKKRGEEIHAILNDYRGPQIPHKLEVGSEWVALMERWSRTRVSRIGLRQTGFAVPSITRSRSVQCRQR